MPFLTTLEIYREDMKFSSGHFTIFSATERERLHGHNFTVMLLLDTIVYDDGTSLDYTFYRNRVLELCSSLDEYFLLPKESPYLKFEEQGDYLSVYFAEDKMIFLKKDVLMLPIRNISVEELARWFVEQLTMDLNMLAKQQVLKLTVKVFTTPGQSGTACWSKDN